MTAPTPPANGDVVALRGLTSTTLLRRGEVKNFVWSAFYARYVVQGWAEVYSGASGGGVPAAWYVRSVNGSRPDAAGDVAVAGGGASNSVVAAFVAADGPTKSALDNTYAPVSLADDVAEKLTAPAGGTTGQVLAKTAFGVAWQAAPSGDGGGLPSSVFTVDPEQQVLPTPLSLVIYGESTTESVGIDWPVNFLAPLLGWTVLNRGKSGQGAGDVVLRQGGLRPRITVAGNSIPASGAVAVSTIEPSTGYRTGGTGAFGFGGSLAGVVGNLAHDLVADTWTFTRTADGAATPCPANTPFLVDQTARRPTWALAIWTGRNNVSPDTLAVAHDLIDLAIVAGISTQIRKYLVLGVINGTNEAPGSNGHTRIVKFNNRLAKQHGEYFYDLRRDFIDRGMTIVGLTPTTADLASIAADTPPASLMTDTIHPNSDGYRAVARLVAEKMLALGWVATLNSDLPPLVTYTSDSFDRANTAAGQIGVTDGALGGTSSLMWTSEGQIAIIDNAVGAPITLSASRRAWVPLTSHPGAENAQHVQVYLTIQDGGACACWTDGSNHYLVRVVSSGDTGAIAIDKRDAGAVTALKQSAAAAFPAGGAWLGLRYKRENGTVTLVATVNGVDVPGTTHVDSSPIAAAAACAIRSAFSNPAFRITQFKVDNR